MIKTPVKEPIQVGAYAFHLLDADGQHFCTVESLGNADQIVSTLNAQKPKCETCGDKRIIYPEPVEQYGGEENWPPARPCPDCPPTTQTGEKFDADLAIQKAITAISKAKTIEGAVAGAFSALAKTKIDHIESQLRQAAARIKDLEKALEKHKHTDECLRYAAKTSKASGVYHCIADCFYSLKAILGEETQDGQE